MRFSYISKSSALKWSSQENFRRAVKRNLLKRRIREAYRLKKQTFIQGLPEGDLLLHLGFVYSSDILADFATVQSELSYFLMQLANRLKKN
ncbi:MAG: ribonuclease P protein component [Bacteroidota bacterium]|nr:MAG: ribonuclease P protein component [Bacteroidota bacterium]